MDVRALFEQLDDKVANSEMGTCFAAQSIYERASMYRGNGWNKLGAAAIVEGIKEEPTSNWERNGRRRRRKNDHVLTKRKITSWITKPTHMFPPYESGYDLVIWETGGKSVFKAWLWKGSLSLENVEL